MSKHWSVPLIAVTALLALSAVAQSSIDPVKEASIRELMQLLGGDEMGEQMSESLLTQVRPFLEDRLPAGSRREAALARMEEKFRSRFNSETLTAKIIPIYDKHLTQKEINQLIAFYQSPLGQRVLEVMPNILEEAQEVGGGWAYEIFDEIAAEMEEEFPELREED